MKFPQNKKPGFTLVTPLNEAINKTAWKAEGSLNSELDRCNNITGRE
jgi:hypothetical protein